MDSVEDDPRRRKPDITVAKNNLGWEHKHPLLNGLNKTIDYFRNELNKQNSIQSNLNEQSFSSLFFTNDELADKINLKTEL